MMYRLERFFGEVLRAVDRMDSQQWIVFSVTAIVIGAILLRGYGSRANY
jgi:hypothetical protein